MPVGGAYIFNEDRVVRDCAKEIKKKKRTRPEITNVASHIGLLALFIAINYGL